MSSIGETLWDGDVLKIVVIPQGRAEDTVTDALGLAFNKSKEAGLAPILVKRQ